MKLSLINRFIKRSFDLLMALFGISIFIWIIILAWMLSTIFHRKNGFFLQDRVGMNGKKFKIIKIRTMYEDKFIFSTTTSLNDPRISIIGRFFRDYKIDELPQLFNVLNGSMSFVGPRPDVEGFADMLKGDEKVILSLRPGITGPATLKYKNEEHLLSKATDVEEENKKIYRDKVRINLQYLNNWSLMSDIFYIFKTFI